jgi:hypothetical protein
MLKPLRRRLKDFFPIFMFFVIIQGSLSAQTGEREGPVSILFMSFTGADREEADQLGSAMYTELEWISRTSGYTVQQSLDTAETSYSIPDLSPEDQASNPKYLINGEIVQEGNVSVVDLSLWDLESSALLFSQGFDYRLLDDALSMIPYFTWSLYSILPVIDAAAEELEAVKAELEALKSGMGGAETGGDYFTLTNSTETSAWKNRWLYLGLKGGLSPRFYIFKNDDILSDFRLTWEAALHAEFQFFRFPWGSRNVFLALQGEAWVTLDRFVLPNENNSTTGKNIFSLMLPLFFKVNYKPGPFVLSLYGGLYFLHYLSSADVSAEVPPLLGYSGGFKFGIKAGKWGVIFFDLRYSADIGITKIDGYFPLSYRRYLPSFALGYEIGLFNRKWRY